MATALMLVAGCTLPPVNTPGPAPAEGPVEQITFVFSVFDVHALPISRRISITITSVQGDGKLAWRSTVAEDIDPVTGQLPADWETRTENGQLMVRQPLFMIRPTTWAHNATLFPGVVSIGAVAVHLGQGGESLVCHIEQNGVVVPGSRVAMTVPAGPIGGMGSATVKCLW